MPVTSPLLPIFPSLYLRPALHMGSKKPPPQFSRKGPRAPEPVPPVIWTLLSYQLLGSGGVNRNSQTSKHPRSHKNTLLLAIPSVNCRLSEKGLLTRVLSFLSLLGTLSILSGFFFLLYFIKLVQMGVEAYPCNPNTQEVEDLRYETSLGHTARPDIKNKQIYFC